MIPSYCLGCREPVQAGSTEECSAAPAPKTPSNASAFCVYGVRARLERIVDVFDG